MYQKMQCIDQEMYSSEVNAKSFSPFQDALKDIFGGYRPTQTESVICAHQQNDKLHFVQLSGRKIQPFTSDQASKSLSYSKKAFDLTNFNRAQEGKGPLTWSDELHTIAYRWAKEQAAQGRISHDAFDQNMKEAQAAIPNVGMFGENVAMNMARTWSSAMDKVIDQWMNSTTGHRE